MPFLQNFGRMMNVGQKRRNISGGIPSMNRGNPNMNQNMMGPPSINFGMGSLGPSLGLMQRFGQLNNEPPRMPMTDSAPMTGPSYNDTVRSGMGGGIISPFMMNYRNRFQM